ncbi:hypothetical protein NQ314_015074 [Rhamnusium bicolor]|uniref:Proteasome activator complex subunit 4-like HEAT repeat-like domain-containing protein n=1 Tax=Rhamnusium bicolor TaxID=1586634 RepID=A0AAV8X214_9CUCU|nr:hypothetical protein NQ314_015074 [Rhamnusium bicolor]
MREFVKTISGYCTIVRHYQEPSKDWDEPRFIHDQYTGYYNWPKKLEVYDSPSKQDTAARRMDNLNDIEQEIYNFL